MRLQQFHKKNIGDYHSNNASLKMILQKVSIFSLFCSSFLSDWGSSLMAVLMADSSSLKRCIDSVRSFTDRTWNLISNCDYWLIDYLSDTSRVGIVDQGERPLEFTGVLSARTISLNPNNKEISILTFNRLFFLVSHFLKLVIWRVNGQDKESVSSLSLIIRARRMKRRFLHHNKFTVASRVPLRCRQQHSTAAGSRHLRTYEFDQLFVCS